MRKVLPFLVVGILIVAALIGSLIYSTDTAIYECSGVMTAPNNSSGPITLFAEITKYRWWAFWNPLDGLLRLEIQTGRIPTVPDDPRGDRWFKTGPNSVKAAKPFPGLGFGPRDSPNEREDLFGIERVESYLVLYRWPKAGETVDLTAAGQGQFSTINNSLKFKLSDEATFNGNCKQKNNRLTGAEINDLGLSIV
jgi:hypothetical protein